MDAFGRCNLGGIWKMTYCLGPLLSAHQKMCQHYKIIEDFVPYTLVLDDFDPQKMVFTPVIHTTSS